MGKVLENSNFIYDKIASKYGVDTEKSTSEYFKYKVLKKYLDGVNNVLDIGCANGIYSIPISKYVNSITAIDINDKLLNIFNEKIEKNNIENIEVYNCDARDINKLDKIYDLIFSYSTLVLVPDLLKVLSFISGLLNNGGRAILDITGKYNLSKFYWKKWYAKQEYYVFNAFSWRDISIELKKLNFDIIDSYAFGFCDQWKYVPILSKMKILDNFFHHKVGKDLDYMISNFPLFFQFANRWQIVVEKRL